MLHFFRLFSDFLLDQSEIELCKICKTKLLFMANLRAICIATPNINTVIYSNFSSFMNIFVVSVLGVTIIGYFVVSSGNGMVFNFTNFTNFFDKTSVFSNFLTLIVIIQVFQLQKARNLVGFANSFLQNFYWPWHKPIFFNFLKILVNF